MEMHKSGLCYSPSVECGMGHSITSMRHFERGRRHLVINDGFCGLLVLMQQDSRWVQLTWMRLLLWIIGHVQDLRQMAVEAVHLSSVWEPGF